MIEAALLANTLVCLPTGLGKTLIAAVVMYNFSRWFPQVPYGLDSEDYLTLALTLRSHVYLNIGSS